jgi:nucleotide-binding universal stress UspA family protein
MDERGRIAVGIDGSEDARIALRWALAEAAPRSVPLEVVHVWREPKAFVPGSYPAELVEMGQMDVAALRLIDRELEAVGADELPSLVIERTEVQGYAAHALIEASERADLVVVGRRGDGAFPHELIGPKVIQIAHHAASPVGVIPDAWPGGGTGVVVGVDGSDNAAHAVRWAAAEASRRSTTLTAVMAWGLLEQHHAGAETTFRPDYSAKNARDALDVALVAALPGAGADDVVRLVVNDLPARALIDAAAGAELLVVGARGFGGFRDLLLGSVSHRCLVHARCPTVVVRLPRS